MLFGGGGGGWGGGGGGLEAPSKIKEENDAKIVGKKSMSVGRVLILVNICGNFVCFSGVDSFLVVCIRKSTNRILQTESVVTQWLADLPLVLEVPSWIPARNEVVFGV